MKLTSTTNNEPEPGRKPHRLKIAAVLVATGTAIASVAGFTSTAGAADPVGSAAGYSVSAATNSIGTGAASVGAQLISWSNSVYASRALQPGFEEFQMSGTAGVSTVVTTGALKAAASTGGPTPNLFWIEGTHTLKSVNFGNAPSPLAVALGPAVPDGNLWVHSAVAGPNRLIKFGTASTVTTSTLMTTTSSSTTSTTTSTTVTTVPPPRVCAKWQKRRVKLGKRKYVTQYVCIKFA